MQIERPKTQQKQILDYNLPFQLVNKSLLKEDSKKISITKDSQQQQQQKHQQDASSRSNSIQGRKLSFCDAHLTVSQNTIESIDRIAVTQRNREDNNQSQYSINGGASQQQYSSFIINQSQSESVLNPKSSFHQQPYAHAIGSRGKNPRQSKEPQKKKKRSMQNISGASLGGQAAQNSNKLQKAIKQQFKIYQQNQSKHGTSTTSGQQQRSPLQERKSQIQQISQYQNVYDGQKGAINRTAINRNVQQPASFMLTFSKDKSNSPNRSRVLEKENNKVYANFEKEGIINIIEQKSKKTPKYSHNDVNCYKNTPSITPNKHTISSGKKSVRPRSQQSSKERKYSSPSPNSRAFKNSVHQNNSYYKNNNRSSIDQINVRSYIGSGEKNNEQTPLSQKQSHSINKLVRENIKKQKEIESKQQEVLAQQQEQLSQRKQKIVIKNKEIRKRNMNKSVLSKQKKKLQISNINEDKVVQIINEKLNEYDNRKLEMQSKSPLKIWQQMQKEKNKDMPLKIEQKRNKKQLGLEIFDIKKELGFDQLSNNNQVSIDQSNNQSTFRQNKVKKSYKLINQYAQDNSSNNIPQNEGGLNKASIKNKKHQQSQVQKMAQEENEKVNTDIQKLIAKQNKKRSKIEKHEKFLEIIKHQRVMENLKSLNRQIEQQRKKKQNESNSMEQAKTPVENNKKHFKTVHEQFQVYGHQNNQDKDLARASQATKSKENQKFTDNKIKIIKNISARRQTLGPVQKLKIKQDLPNNRVVYSYISQGKQVSIGQRKSKSKGKPHLKKDQLIQMLLEQLKGAKNSQAQDRSVSQLQSKSLQKRKNSLGKMQKSGSYNQNKSVQQYNQLYAASLDSPQLRLKKKRKSKQENRVLKNHFESDFSNLGSRSLQNSPARSTNDKRESSSLFVPTAKLMKQNNKANKNDEDEGMEVEGGEDEIIDDEMMIFCVLNTAASIIQKHYKIFKQRKWEAQRLESLKKQEAKRSQNQAKNEESKNVFGQQQDKSKNSQEVTYQLKDSALFENRILPLKDAKIPINDQTTLHSKQQMFEKQQQYQQQQRKTPQHTFSFGNQDEYLQAAQQPNSNFSSFYENQNVVPKQQNLTQHSQSTNQHRETSPVEDITPLGNGVSIFSQNFINHNEIAPASGQQLFNLNSNPIVESVKINATNYRQEPNNQISKSNQQTQNLKQMQQVERDEQQDSDQVEEEELKRVLNIDGKLKKALQSLVKQQKSNHGFEMIKRKQPKNSNQVDKVVETQDRFEESKQTKRQNAEERKYIGSEISSNQISKEVTRKDLQIQSQAVKESTQPPPSQVLKQSNDDSFNLLQKHLDKNDTSQNEEDADFSKISLDEQDFDAQNQDLHEQRPNEVQNNKFIHDSIIEHDPDNQSEGDLSSSILASFGEQTDKIIQSSPINTNEEILDAAINESNTLINESGVNESHLLQHSRVEDSQLNINVFQSEKGFGMNGQNNSSMINDEENGEGFNFDMRNREEKKVGSKSEKSNNEMQYNDMNKLQFKQKPMLRLMFGDEQYLRLQEEQDNASYDRELVSNLEFLGSGPSSNRMLQSDNPYFLATNASIFERNPFKDFTSNKLSDILAGKNSKELLEMKEDALKYQEKLEKGFITRLERKSELSPISSQRRQYELECWVTNERKNIQNQKKEKQLLNTPLNVFDLEQERKEAARIIEQVNKKAQDIKGKLTSQKSNDLNFSKRQKEFNTLQNQKVTRLEEEQKSGQQLSEYNPFNDKNQHEHEKIDLITKQQDHIFVKEYAHDEKQNNYLEVRKPQKEEAKQNNFKEDPLDASKSLSRLDLSEEFIVDEKKQKLQIQEKPSTVMPELYSLSKESDHGKDELPTIELEISFDDNDENLLYDKSAQKQNSEPTGGQAASLQKPEIKQLSLLEEIKKTLQEKEDRQAQVDQVTQEIFEYLLKDQLSFQKFIPKRDLAGFQPLSKNDSEKSKELPKNQNVLKELHAVSINDNDFKALKSNEIIAKKNTPESHNEIQDPLSARELKEVGQIEGAVKKAKLIIDVVIPESEKKQRAPIQPYGIDTSEKATLKYIEDIFDQIKSRKDLFMQAFATPIYKNPLEILSNLQRPDYGDFEVTVDLSNSLSCILNVQLYLTLEKARDNLIHQTIQQIKQSNLSASQGISSENQNLPSEDELADLITESQHIHNKVIFDCVNEALNSVRPYSGNGEPMPWSSKPRKNLIFLLDDPDNIDKILLKVKAKVMSLSRTKAGALPPRYPDQSQYNNQQMENIIQMDEEVFSQQREKCLAQMLAKDLIDGEEKWLDYEMEEAQVKIDLSDIVLEQLVGEVCDVLKEIEERRRQDREVVYERQ